MTNEQAKEIIKLLKRIVDLVGQSMGFSPSDIQKWTKE